MVYCLKTKGSTVEEDLLLAVSKRSIFIILHVYYPRNVDQMDATQQYFFSLLQDLGTLADNNFLSDQHLKSHLF